MIAWQNHSIYETLINFLFIANEGEKWSIRTVDGMKFLNLHSAF